MSNFDNQQVKRVSEFVQKYMRDNKIDKMSPDECAEILTF